MKGWHGILLLVGLVVCVGVHEALADIPYIDLFRGRDQTDYRVRLNSSGANLESYYIDNQVYSIRYHGNFIFYDYSGYNRGTAGSKYVTEFNSRDSTFVEFTDASFLTASSVRFIGSYVNGSHLPSLTLFNNPYFGGMEEELLTASKSTLSNIILSAIIVGVSDWTFYDDINFNGPGLCIKGSSNYTGVQLFPLTLPPGSVSLYEKKSVEVGCWERHGVRLEQ